MLWTYFNKKNQRTKIGRCPSLELMKTLYILETLFSRPWKTIAVMHKRDAMYKTTHIYTCQPHFVPLVIYFYVNTLLYLSLLFYRQSEIMKYKPFNLVLYRFWFWFVGYLYFQIYLEWTCQFLLKSWLWFCNLIALSLQILVNESWHYNNNEPSNPCKWYNSAFI